MKKADFIKAVAHEVKTLRKIATPEELANLKFEVFNPLYPTRCIYGQMTGNCGSKRAKTLMDEACIIVTNCGSHGVHNFDEKKYKDVKGLINGKNESQGWIGEGGGTFNRKYSHLSALEAYICLKDAKTENVISYLRGDSKTLKL